MDTPNLIHIYIPTNAAHLPFARTVAASIAALATVRCAFHLACDTPFSDVETAKFHAALAENALGHTIDAPALGVSELFGSFLNTTKQAYSIDTFTRLLCPAHAATLGAEVCITLDTDVLATDDIAEIFAEIDTTAIPQWHLAAAPLLYQHGSDEVRRHINTILYFNLGVACWNVTQWIADFHDPKFIINALEDIKGWNIHNEEGAVNWLAQNKRDGYAKINLAHLPLRWNANMVLKSRETAEPLAFWYALEKKIDKDKIVEEIDAAIADPGIVHFIGAEKPWGVDINPAFAPYAKLWNALHTTANSPEFEEMFPKEKENLHKVARERRENVRQEHKKRKGEREQKQNDFRRTRKEREEQRNRATTGRHELSHRQAQTQESHAQRQET
jgi:lipopolysaccharide biosynthesis glycosyltransferase